MNFERVKSLFFWRKKPEKLPMEVDGEGEPGEDTEADIELPDEMEPEDKAKTLKKKAMFCIGGAVALCAVTAVGSNVFFSGKPPSDKPLASGMSMGNSPTQGLPDKYSDLAKYAADGKGQKGNGAAAGNAAAQQDRGHASPPSPSNASGYSQSRPMQADQGVSYHSGAAPANNNSQAAQEAAAEAKREEAIANCALSFKIAADVATGASGVGAGVGAPAAVLQEVGESFVLDAGSVIQATLLTGVTSDVANGDVVAQVRQDVYDSLTGQHLLIPQGSRLIGKSGTAGNRGNKRIGVVFTRLIMPNGRSMDLPGQQAIDGTGYPGLMDRYDDHASTLYRTGFMTALLAAAAQSATGGSSGSDDRSPGQEAVAGAAASVLRMGEKIIARDANMNPTIEIEPGYQFSVFINQDVSMGAYSDD